MFILATFLNFLPSDSTNSSLNYSRKWIVSASLIEVLLLTLLSYPKYLCFFIPNLAPFNPKGLPFHLFSSSWKFLNQSYPSSLESSIYSIAFSSFWLTKNIHKNIQSRGKHTGTHQEVKRPHLDQILAQLQLSLCPEVVFLMNFHPY